jgi:hypothetical protein
MSLRSTRALENDRAHLYWCQNCGVLLYVPDPIEGKAGRPAGPCPSCAKTLWTERKHSEGPFQMEDDA